MEHVSSAHPTGKFPEKVKNLKGWARFPGWNFRTECRVLVVCTSSRSTVGHRDVPGFTTKWNNFLPIGNSTFAPNEISGFFPKWKGPLFSLALVQSKDGLCYPMDKFLSSGKRNWFPKYLSAGWIVLFSFLTTGARLHCPLEKEWENNHNNNLYIIAGDKRSPQT